MIPGRPSSTSHRQTAPASPRAQSEGDLMRLDVYVCDTLVGQLTPISDGGFAFTYRPDTDPNHFVSLTMPVPQGKPS